MIAHEVTCRGPVVILPLTMAATQPDEAVKAARTYVDAMIRSDVEALRRQHTADALFVAGDVGGPLTGAEGALIQPALRSCAIGPMVLQSDKVAPDMLSTRTPRSIRNGTARSVTATLSCPDDAGGTRISTLTLVIAGNRVAIVSLMR